MNLSKLQSVDLRKSWEKETNFTNWLTKEENLELLSEELGIGKICFIGTEESVGSFRVDILAEGEDKKEIIIENQFGTTDHDHLGKAITYASGCKAEIVIWIVEDYREEHKKAVDFLNSHTDDKLSFFLVRIELWQIDDSNPAPKFEVISQPNSWEKMLNASRQKELSPFQLLQHDFWTRFKEYCINNNSTLQIQKIKPDPKNWFDIRYGDSKSRIRLFIDFQNGKISTSIYIDSDKLLYSKFESNKEKFKEELDKLEWNPPTEDKKSSKIMTQKQFDDIKNDKNWEECFGWLKKTAEKFCNVRENI